jgi:hypothetical protein
MRTALLLPAVLLAACEANNPTYFGPTLPLETGQEGAMEMGPATAAVTLDFRSPSNSEQQSLTNETRTSGHQMPWLRADHEAIELIYTVTNLSDKGGIAQLELDGASELVSYDTSAMRAAIALLPRQQQNEVTVLPLMAPTPIAVGAHQSVSGTVGEDDFAEAALDLDAIGRWMAVPAQVLINRSEANPIGLEQVPKALVVPALFRVTVYFSATQHMKMEFLVRVRDEDRQLRGGQDNAFKPQPRAYQPPALTMMMPAAMMPAAAMP